MSYNNGNNFAEKWTEEVTIKKLEEIEQYAIDNQCFFLGQMLVHFKLYRDWWSYIKDKYSQNSNVLRFIKNIEYLCETNLVEKGVNGETNATMTIFTLKNHHNYTDGVTMIANTDNKGNNIDLKKYTDDELRTLAELQRKGGISE